MSHRFVPVGWNRSKLVYDALLIAGIVLYLLIYLRLDTQLDDQTRAIRAYGSCAFLMLSIVLGIGPLARLDPRTLPLLYNRRHFGVLTCAVAIGHAAQVLDWYFAYSRIPPAEALLSAESSFQQLHGFPFIPFGIAALAILLVLAATSHDFWLAYLTPPVWKSMHMAVYGAYALAVLHIALGALQDQRPKPLLLTVCASAFALIALHLAAALRERRQDAATAPPAPETPWLDAGPVTAFEDGAARIVHPPDGEAVAIFRIRDTLSAVSNLCAHQNGPLGEGRVIDGCITCPWHGFQYRPEDGCAPPPYTEKLPTYTLRIVDGRVWLDPRAKEAGTFVEAARIDGGREGKRP